MKSVNLPFDVGVEDTFQFLMIIFITISGKYKVTIDMDLVGKFFFRTFFLPWVDFSATLDFCFRFPPIVTLVNFVFQTTGHVFFYNEEKYCLIYCRNNKRTSITVLLSKVMRRAVERWLGKAVGAWSSDWFIALALLWHECLQTWWSMAYLSKER